MRENLMRKRLLTSTSIAGAFLLATPAFAQTQEAPTAPATSDTQCSDDAGNPVACATEAPATAPGAQQGEAIVVTGSRIPHPNLESASPVTIVGNEEIKQTGTTRVEDVINALPQVFASQGGGVANGASGTATLNLRGLGTSRTLVLVNGRRVVPGDPNLPVADINIIPGALVKRVDVLTGGASSVYGADAVAGVVNFVMDTEFEGFKLDSQYSFYDHVNRVGHDVTDALDAKGFGYPTGHSANGGAVDVTGIIGAGFDDNRGHVTAFAGYRRLDAVLQSSRDYSACSLSDLSAADAADLGRNYNCGGSGTSPAGSFYKVSTRNYYHLEGTQFVPGRVLFNYGPYNYYQRPDERYTAGFFAHYDVSDAVKPYMEFMFMDDRTVAQIAPSGDFFNTGTLNCDNPLLSAQQRATICSADNVTVGADGVTRAGLYIGRRNVEGGGRQDDLQHTDYRGVFGVKGDIGRGLSYDAYYQYSRVNLSETYRNDFSVRKLTNALDVVTDPTTGAPVCRSVLDGTDGACVPYNIFTEGGVTQDQLNYLQTPGFQRGQNTEQVFNASVTMLGDEYGIASPFATEGLGLNVGYEYRKETLNLETDNEFQTGDLAGQGGATIGQSGELDVNEAFVEASLPLVQDKPFFEDLRIGGGYRRSHYTTSGNGVTNSFDTDTYKVTASWQPVRDIKFRASYNRAVRAPNIVELFSVNTVLLDGSTDPCAGDFDPATETGEPSATQAQCALTGVSAAQYGQIAANPAGQYNGLLGGNPNLTPEISDSYTAGVVLTPGFLPGFQATVDYFNIKIDNLISTYGADTILQQCVQSGSPDFCGLIHRDSQGTLFRTPDGYVVDTNKNTGALRTDGIDITAAYTTEIGNAGTIGLNYVGTYLNSIVTDPTGDPGYDCKGYYGSQCGTPNPEYRHKARATYTLPFGASLSLAWRYFSSVKIDTLSPDTDLNGGTPSSRPGDTEIGSQSYFDLAATVPVADKFTMHVGANNILDREPPISGLGLNISSFNGNTFPVVYDALGRYIYVGVTLEL